jgi:hypothetical protein
VRRLEVVAVSDDGTYVLLASDGAGRPTHSVRIDGRLHAALRGKLDDSGRRESELSPKEIQARLRAGESAEQIAKLAKVPVARVNRYAGPVISERDRIIEQARATALRRPRGPQQRTPLGEVVTARLAATVGLRPETVSWTAQRREDGGWVVNLSYAARGGTRTASWLWQPTDRVLTSLNNLATRLGAEDPPAPPRRATATKRAAKRAPAKRAAKRTTPKRPTVDVAGSTDVAKPEKASGNDAANTPAKSATKPVKSSNGRVAVPSWSDVLIGVQAPAAARGRRRS